MRGLALLILPLRGTSSPFGFGAVRWLLPSFLIPPPAVVTHRRVTPFPSYSCKGRPAPVPAPCRRFRAPCVCVKAFMACHIIGTMLNTRAYFVMSGVILAMCVLESLTHTHCSPYHAVVCGQSSANPSLHPSGADS